MFIAAQFTIPSYGSSLCSLKLMKGLRNCEIIYICTGVLFFQKEGNCVI
jgi:hypothetical protein